MVLELTVRQVLAQGCNTCTTFKKALNYGKENFAVESVAKILENFHSGCGYDFRNDGAVQCLVFYLI